MFETPKCVFYNAARSSSTVLTAQCVPIWIVHSSWRTHTVRAFYLLNFGPAFNKLYPKRLHPSSSGPSLLTNSHIASRLSLRAQPFHRCSVRRFQSWRPLSATRFCHICYTSSLLFLHCKPHVSRKKQIYYPFLYFFPIRANTSLLRRAIR